MDINVCSTYTSVGVCVRVLSTHFSVWRTRARVFGLVFDCVYMCVCLPLQWEFVMWGWASQRACVRFFFRRFTRM